MSNKINPENDKYFISLVEQGILKVYKDGSIKNTQTGNYIGSENKAGYIQIGFKKSGKVLHMLVHRLVYIVYKYKMRPLPFIVNHRDGVKSNNYYRNLERSNDSHNTKHAWDTGLTSRSNEQRLKQSKTTRGEKGSNAKLTNKQADRLRSLYSRGSYSYRDLARKFDLHHSTVGSIIRRETFV